MPKKKPDPKPKPEQGAAAAVSGPIQAPVQQRLRQRISIAFDTSVSMGSIWGSARNMLDQLKCDIAANAALHNIETEVSLITFDSDVKRVCQNVAIEKLPTLGSHHRLGPSTKLLSGVHEAIAAATVAGDEIPTLVLVITDGQENDSTITAKMLRDKMEAKMATGTWTFAFHVPPRHARPLFEQFSVPLDNIHEWEGNIRGVSAMTSANTAAVSDYYNIRAGGQTATASYFKKVTTDASNIDPTKLKAELIDMSRQFKQYRVEKEDEVRPFIEGKAGKYVIGGAYYQLMKPEKVQASKSVILQPKGEKKFYGGPAARRLIGLPDGQPAKVTPGNHANYDIFIQSTSVNRKLPRGTSVLVDLAHHVNLPATW